MQRALLREILSTIEDLEPEIQKRRAEGLGLQLHLIQRIDQVEPYEMFIDSDLRTGFLYARREFKLKQVGDLGWETVAELCRKIKSAVESALTAPISGPDSKFKFIVDPDIKYILDRDLEEAETSFQRELFKASLVLCGSILEIVLYELLRKDVVWTMDPSRKRKAFDNKKPPDISSNVRQDSWTLRKLIDFCCDNTVLDDILWRNVLHEHIEEPRNLVHGTAELRKKYLVTEEAASSSLNLLKKLLLELETKTFPP